MAKSKSSRSSKRKSKGKSSKGESQCTLFKAFAYSGVLLALIAVPLLYPVQTEVALFKVAHKVLVWKLTQWDGLTYAELGCSPEAAAMSTILSLERLPLPDYEKNREAMDKLEHVLHVDPECFFEDTTLIKQDTLAAHIPVRMVLPKHVRKRPVTTVLYLHGGGFVSGSPRSHTALACEIARLTGSRVVSVDYRLAPENSIADAIDDAVHAYRDLLRQSEPGSFVFMGDSAGGGLAVLALQAIRDDPDVPLPAGAVLLSPWTNLASDPAAYKTREESDVLFAGINALPETGCVAAGLGLGCDYDKLKDPQFSALYGSMDGLPPLYILAGDAEMLADDSIKLADKAKKAGVDVELHLVEKMQHVFPLFADFLPEGREWLERASKWAYERVEGEEA